VIVIYLGEVKMKSIEELDVFKLGYELGLEVYKITSTYPASELYGLVSQMKRAAVSVNSNLSEGGSRINKGELKQFIGIARGSAAELKTQLCFSKDLGFINNEIANNLIEKTEKIKRMLSGLLNSLNQQPVTIN
jgi:four helix bundle protein